MSSRRSRRSGTILLAGFTYACRREATAPRSSSAGSSLRPVAAGGSRGDRLSTSASAAVCRSLPRHRPLSSIRGWAEVSMPPVGRLRRVRGRGRAGVRARSLRQRAVHPASTAAPLPAWSVPSRRARRVRVPGRRRRPERRAPRTGSEGRAPHGRAPSPAPRACGARRRRRREGRGCAARARRSGLPAAPTTVRTAEATVGGKLRADGSQVPTGRPRPGTGEPVTGRYVFVDSHTPRRRWGKPHRERRPGKAGRSVGGGDPRAHRGPCVLQRRVLIQRYWSSGRPIWPY